MLLVPTHFNSLLHWAVLSCCALSRHSPLPICIKRDALFLLVHSLKMRRGDFPSKSG